MAEETIAFEIGGASYQARRMDLFTQISIVTKLAPLLAGGLAQALHLYNKVMQAADNKLPAAARTALALSRILDLPKGDLLDQLAPLAADLAKMPQEDQRFIIANTLAMVQVNRGDAGRPQWTSIWPAGLPEATFPEFRNDLILTLRVVGTVLMATLGPFSLGSR